MTKVSKLADALSKWTYYELQRQLRVTPIGSRKFKAILAELAVRNARKPESARIGDRRSMSEGGY